MAYRFIAIYFNTLDPNDEWKIRRVEYIYETLADRETEHIPSILMDGNVQLDLISVSASEQV